MDDEEEDGDVESYFFFPEVRCRLDVAIDGTGVAETDGPSSSSTELNVTWRFADDRDIA